ncbi:MAG TPA: glycosyltransferase [Rhodospirillaceae bacterium]|nr:glycosyltransferase [Rhodospirillaceae bacterium]
MAMVPVTPELLKDRKLLARTSHAHLARMATTMLVAEEVAAAAETFPILFSRSDGAILPVALFSLTSDDNLFVEPDGAWSGGYMPAGLRLYPFTLGLAKGSNEPELVVDIDSGLVSEDEGEPLFGADGLNTSDTPAKRALRLATLINQGAGKTVSLTAQIAKAGLLEPVGLPLGARTGRQLLTVTPAALADLQEPVRQRLRLSGALALIEHQLASQRHLEALRQRLARRYLLWIAATESGSAVPPPAAAATLGFLMIASSGSEAGIVETLDSLKRQSSADWQLLIVLADGLTLSSDDRRVLCRPLPAADRQILAELNGRYFAFLEPGDQLPTTAVAEVSEVLARDPAIDVLYSDDDILVDGQRRDPFFKPEWSPDLLTAFNYFGRLTVLRRELALSLGGLADPITTAPEWELNLRMSRHGAHIVRFPKILCHRPQSSRRDRPRPADPASAAHRQVVADHWRHLGFQARIETRPDGIQQASWDIAEPPLVSIIIPSHDDPDSLRKCIDGLLKETNYPRKEVIIVDNFSTNPQLVQYYHDLENTGKARVIHCINKYTYSSACNAGARDSNGELLLFLDHSIEIVAADWLDELVRQATLPGVGVAGPLLTYPDGLVRRAGLALGLHDRGPIFHGLPTDFWGISGSPAVPRNCLAVTGECLLMRRQVFERIGGFDEGYRLTEGAVAFCLRAWRAGLRNVYTPFARLVQAAENMPDPTVFLADQRRLYAELRSLGITDDPYFHPALDGTAVIPALRLGKSKTAAEVLRHEARLLRSAYPPSSRLNLFDDLSVAAACGLGRQDILWPAQSPAAIDDHWSAARFCIDVLRSRPDLRARFPEALSAGGNGGFALWLREDGGRRLGLTPAALRALGEVFARRPAERVRQTFFLDHDLHRRFPLGLTPAGRRGLVRWLMRDGVEDTKSVRKVRIDGLRRGFRREEIWWFLLESAENPARELVRTYNFTAEWQRLFPDGLTVFGRDQLAAWLAGAFQLDEEWSRPDRWPVALTAAQQIRLAYGQRPYWQHRHPQALGSLAAARAFLSWLDGAEAGLAEPAQSWCRHLDKEETARELMAPGVNIFGHFCFPSGLRHSVESVAEGLRRIGTRLSKRDIFVTFDTDEPNHCDYDGLEIYETTLIHAQPGGPLFLKAFQNAGLAERDPRSYRIGYWYWELDTIPAIWKPQAAMLDELWAATDFIADALRQNLTLPVFKMPPGVELPAFTPRSRAYFNLPENKFIFLFVFAMSSIMERKNPIALTKAFRQAFGDDPNVSLVIKTSFGELHASAMKDLRQAADDAGVILIDRVFTQNDTLALMQTCDCYISLHRSEGLGLTMAEAMLLGKPAIATGYSGNVDFMTSTNSLLVDYRLVELTEKAEPYEVGARWAEPSIDHAAQLMRRVHQNRDWARRLGETARADLGSRLSLEAAGRRMADRLAEIRGRKPADAKDRPRLMLLE